MATVQSVLDALEEIAPRRFAFDFDRIGLQVGDPTAQVHTAVVSLDRSLGAIAFARSLGAQLLVSHHPLIWEPLRTLDERRHAEKSATELVRAGINFIAAHTNWDCAKGGINDVLAQRLGLSEVKSFGSAATVPMLKLVAFVPEEAVERVIDAASAAGAGRLGGYERCAFMAEGRGTFMGGERTTPSIGVAGRREVVPEVRIEMLVPEGRSKQVVRALRAAHPYEEPAHDLFRLDNFFEQPLGRIGKLRDRITFRELIGQIDERLDTRSMCWGEPNSFVRTVAVVGGAADGEWLAARNEGADVIITGEVKQNIAVEASEGGLKIVAAGHYATEQPGCVALRDRLATAIPVVDWELFEPAEGIAGRPV